MLGRHRTVLTRSALVTTLEQTASIIRRIHGHVRAAFCAEQRSRLRTAVRCKQPARNFAWNPLVELATATDVGQVQLVQYLKDRKCLESSNCIRAMSLVDRKDFVRDDIPEHLIHKVRKRVASFLHVMVT
jgi:hypothetical protein